MLSDLTSVTFSDVSETSFSVTLFEEAVRIGDAFTCTHAGDGFFDCADFYHEMVPIPTFGPLYPSKHYVAVSKKL